MTLDVENKRRGFTILELLVSIGIIAVLISILLPALRNSRESARSVQCLSNLQQIGAAATAYSMKYEGCTVPGYANLGVTVSGNGNLADGENYATILANEGMIKVPVLPSVTSPVASGDNPLRCPSGTEDFIFNEFTDSKGSAPSPNGRKDILGARPLRTKSMASGRIVDTWYGVNQSLDNMATDNSPIRRLPPAGNNSDWRITHTTAIKDSSKMVFLFDGIFYDLSYDADRINARHEYQRRTNLLFFDNHAESVATNSLPGGFGPNAPGTDIFTTAKLGKNPKWDWRMDQN